MTSKKQLGTITILIKDRQMHAKDVNQLLTDAGHIIMARLGVNVQPACIAHCTGLIVVAIQGTSKQIADLTKRLNKLYGIVAKSSIVSN
ncbi:MAG: hypothetical protein WC465_01890 [Patescibacteria group bacterium]